MIGRTGRVEWCVVLGFKSPPGQMGFLVTLRWEDRYDGWF